MIGGASMKCNKVSFYTRGVWLFKPNFEKNNGIWVNLKRYDLPQLCSGMRGCYNTKDDTIHIIGGRNENRIQAKLKIQKVERTNPKHFFFFSFSNEHIW